MSGTSTTRAPRASNSRLNDSFCEIDRVVVGADSLSQLAQIVIAANAKPIGNLPDLCCEDEHLINPAHW